MSEVVLLKLGGSLITDKARPETPRREVLIRLAGEVARNAAERPFRLILGHGSGSFGHVAAQRFDLASGIRSVDQLPGISFTQERAAALHRLVIAALAEAGALPFSIAPSSCLVAAGGEPIAFAAESLLLALERGLLPVLYGDVVMDRERGAAICSTEKLFDFAVRRLLDRGWTVRRVIWLGETDGLYDTSGKTVPHLSAADFAAAVQAIGAPAGTDVTGGMRHRVETALALARLGVPSLLANGLIAGLLERALRGEEVPGTVVL
ncbi:MAG TPA: isopentenyl phosphate kinase [Thermoanaerobaculia bacterium]|jgi:isopentenyl phosphate kinase|nr:isopentenyl phosphate kinase [Thermoanaerobaculia bacterium]